MLRFCDKLPKDKGLGRNAAGGFGAKIPEPAQSGSGIRIYGPDDETKNLNDNYHR